MENKNYEEAAQKVAEKVSEKISQELENENKKPGFFKRNRWTIVAAVVGTAAGVLIGSKTAREKVVALGNDGLNACKNAFSKKDAPVLEEAPVVAEETQATETTAQSEEQKPNHNKWEGKYKGGWNNNRPKYNNFN